MPKSFATRRLRPTPSRPPKAEAGTVAEFVEQALTHPPAPPPSRPTKPIAAPRKRYAGIWEDMTPEERSAHAKKLAAMRQGKNMARPHKRKRGPRGWSAEDAAVVKAQAHIEAEALVARLIEEGQIDEGDAEGARATAKALARVASPGGCQRERMRTAQRLLRHYHPELGGTV